MKSPRSPSRLGSRARCHIDIISCKNCACPRYHRYHLRLMAMEAADEVSAVTPPTCAAVKVLAPSPAVPSYLMRESLNWVVDTDLTSTWSLTAQVTVEPLDTPSISMLAPAVKEEAPAQINIRSTPPAERWGMLSWSPCQSSLFDCLRQSRCRPWWRAMPLWRGRGSGGRLQTVRGLGRLGWPLEVSIKYKGGGVKWVGVDYCERVVPVALAIS